MQDIIKNWVVHPHRMKENIQLTRGLTFSQSVLLALTNKGMSREQAYQIVQRNSLKAWKENIDFAQLISSDAEVSAVLTLNEVNQCFSLDSYLEKIDYIFERVLGHESEDTRLS